MKLCNEICNDGVFNMQTILYANIIRVTNSPLKFPYVVDDLITGRLNLRTRLKVYGLRTQNVKSKIKDCHTLCISFYYQYGKRLFAKCKLL